MSSRLAPRPQELARCARLVTPTAEPWLLNADIRGDTPLIVATRYGRSAKVARLLALGADVGATDQGGQTALH